MRKLLAALAIVCILTPLVGAMAAVSCPDDPAGACGTDCLDCICCPHPGPMMQVTAELDVDAYLSGPPPSMAVASAPLPHPRRIPHVPKPVLG